MNLHSNTSRPPLHLCERNVRVTGGYVRRTFFRPLFPVVWALMGGACSPSEVPTAIDTSNPGQNGSGGVSLNLIPASGGHFSTGGASFVGTDYGLDGLNGLGGATASGLGAGDLTVLLLIDRSSSMSESWDSGSKWEVSLNAFFLGLVGVEDEVTLGALFFPTDGECSVASMTAPAQFEYQSGRDFVSSWKAKASSIFPEGQTPLGPAFEQADVAIQKAFEAGLMENRRFRVVVVTDGAPNCNTDTTRVLSLAHAWRSIGVEVRVIGLPGSGEATAFLSQLANPNDEDGLVTPGSGADAEDEFFVVIR